MIFPRILIINRLQHDHKKELNWIYFRCIALVFLFFYDDHTDGHIPDESNLVGFSNIIIFMLWISIQQEHAVSLMRMFVNTHDRAHDNNVYNINFRCVALLILPQVCSKQGRAMLISYIFLITLSGPSANIFENIGVLTASLSCGEVITESALLFYSKFCIFCW